MSADKKYESTGVRERRGDSLIFYSREVTDNPQSNYEDQLITRSAPRWAWAVLDETLGVDARSGAFSADLRADIIAASTAVQLACDRADDEPISRADVDEHNGKK